MIILGYTVKCRKKNDTSAFLWGHVLKLTVLTVRYQNLSLRNKRRWDRSPVLTLSPAAPPAAFASAEHEHKVP